MDIFLSRWDGQARVNKVGKTISVTAYYLNVKLEVKRIIISVMTLPKFQDPC